MFYVTPGYVPGVSTLVEKQKKTGAIYLWAHRCSNGASPLGKQTQPSPQLTRHGARNCPLEIRIVPVFLFVLLGGGLSDIILVLLGPLRFGPGDKFLIFPVLLRVPIDGGLSELIRIFLGVLLLGRGDEFLAVFVLVFVLFRCRVPQLLAPLVLGEISVHGLFAKIVLVLVLLHLLLCSRAPQLLAIMVFDDVSVHGIVAKIVIVHVLLHIPRNRRSQDGGAVLQRVGSPSPLDEDRIEPVRFRILSDRGCPDRLLVLSDILGHRQIDKSPLAVLDALHSVAQLVPNASVLQRVRTRHTRCDKARESIQCTMWK